MKVPLLNFVGGPGVPILNFEGGPVVPLLNFRRVPGPTLKLRGGPRSRVPGSRGPRFRGSGPTFTPCPILGPIQLKIFLNNSFILITTAKLVNVADNSPIYVEKENIQ